MDPSWNIQRIGYKSYPRFRASLYAFGQEFCLAACILLILYGVSIRAYSEIPLRAMVLHVTGPLFREKLQVMLHYAYRGEWPADVRQLSSQWCARVPEEDRSDYLLETRMEGGAISFRLGKQLEGRIVTLRPAVPVGAPDGPIRWVCGPVESFPGWRVEGEDRTTLENRYLPESWIH